MIPQETIQLIQNRIDIIDIIGNFIKLKKRGSNYLGVCPFHNEKSPSFTVSPSKEIYKCFGCGKSGNAISFIMEHEKYSYVDTLKWLASRYNIEIQEEYSNPEQRIQQQAAESLFIINKFAKDYFSNNLFENEEGKMAGLGYLKERGFNEETIQKFQLGYCLEYGDAFAKFGIIGILMRIEDKIQRSLSITKNGINLVESESLKDTLLDLHNYAAMGLMLL